VIDPDPVEDAPAEIEMKLALETAVHAQVLVVVTDNDAAPPAEDEDVLVSDNAYEHVGVGGGGVGGVPKPHSAPGQIKQLTPP
jgi:hypothetical protein